MKIQSIRRINDAYADQTRVARLTPLRENMRVLKEAEVAGFKEKYGSWSETKKNGFILIIVFLIGLLATIPFLFLNNPGVMIGWAAGSVVNFIAFLSISMFSSALLSSGESHKLVLVVAFSFVRFALYAGVLLLAGFATFKWGSMDHGYCNIVSTALALMPNWIVLAIATLARNSKKGNEE